MPHRRMAFLTKLRRPSDKQRRLVRAVRRVADHAVLRRWRVLPQERPPLLGVAGDAGFVDPIAPSQRFANTAVGIVAIATNELTVAHRMRRALESIRQHIAVAASANIGLLRRRPHGVRLGVDAMTVATGQIRFLVGATRPMHALIGFVAGKAQSVLEPRLGIAPRPEVQHRFATGFVAQHSATVFASGAVASLALQSSRRRRHARHLEGRVRHRGMSMHGGEDRQCREGLLCVVAAEAAVGAATRVVAFGEFPREFVMGIAERLRARGSCRYHHRCQREGEPLKRLSKATLPLNDAVPPSGRDRPLTHDPKHAVSTTPNTRTSALRQASNVAAICIAMLAASAPAEIDGASLAKDCNDCHGADGRSDEPNTPSIAGFSEFAIMDLMQTYRDGLREGRRMERTDGTETDMVEVSRALSDEELEAVALHYAEMVWQPHAQPFDAKRARRGDAVHRIKCAKCHIEGGSIPEADLAILAGQWRDYLTAQFQAFDDKKRRMVPKMKSKYESLSDTDKMALIEFYVSAGN